MIRVARGPAPEGFASQTAAWREEYDKKLETNPEYTINDFWKLVRKRRKMEEYAGALSCACHDKCAYCESTPYETSPLNVEHFRPKSRAEFADGIFDWENWLIVCELCNTNKGTKFPYCTGGRPCFIDPASEDPSLHFDFLEADVLCRTWRAEVTKTEIRLNRTGLKEKRSLWLRMSIDPLLLLLLVKDPSLKAEVRRLLIWTMQDDAPYSAMTRAYLAHHTPRLANPDTPHPPVAISEPFARIAELVQKFRSEFIKQL